MKVVPLCLNFVDQFLNTQNNIKDAKTENNSVESMHSKMQISIVLMFLLAVAASQSFFLDYRDLKKLLRHFPSLNGVFREEPATKAQPSQAFPELYYDEFDGAENQQKYQQSQPHEPCDHPDHHPQKGKRNEKPERKEKHKYDNINEEIEDYQNERKKGHQQKRYKGMDDEVNLKKDYISGILVAIPRPTKGDEDEEEFDGRKPFFLLQNFLKGIDGRHPEGGFLKSFNYR